ncbi:helix-turn-helix domain-containing protein [Nonomuraea typhae]|uniref:helix-turn-helix domain-containing protein n=1 Tax=Nonomuraea typhae TaxID=2603600 RepID=UPI0012F8D031|nr:helix-turn-helix domain-containing protein [Nonomuraea typhae]
MTGDLKERVRELRATGRSPKEIARALGVKPSVVAPLVREIAAEAVTGGGPALVGSWINTGWSTGLSIDPSYGWTDEAAGEPDTGGLVSVLVARRHGYDRVSVCGYLADVYCLGVKVTHGPEIMDERGMRQFRDFFFSDYSGYQEAPIELARQIVYGSEEYAKGLGFESFEDFELTKGHLGDLEGPTAITFGRNGRPFYVPSPQDDQNKVHRQLRRAVGDAFDYVEIDTEDDA